MCLRTRGGRKFGPPAKIRVQTKDVVAARGVLSWKEVAGKKTADARPAAMGYKEPDLLDGKVDFAGCVTSRPSNLQLISLGTFRRRKIWTLVFKHASP